MIYKNIYQTTPSNHFLGKGTRTNRSWLSLNEAACIKRLCCYGKHPQPPLTKRGQRTFKVIAFASPSCKRGIEGVFSSIAIHLYAKLKSGVIN
jgi:hypothetical protein